MEDFSIAQLRALVEFSKLGTMSAVARSLGYTPGAISQQLAALEQSLETELFEKHGRRVVLNTAGSILAERAKTILTHAYEAEVAVRDSGESMAGTLRIGVFATSSSPVLARVISEMTESYPLVTFETRELALEQTTPAVQRAEVDIALGINYSSAPIPREDGVTLEPICLERFMLAVPAALSDPEKTYKLADFKERDWILSGPNTFFGQAIRAACREHGFEPRVPHLVTDTFSSLSFVAMGLGVTPVTRLMAGVLPSPDITVVDAGNFFEREIVLVRKSNYRRPLAQAFAERMTDALAEYGQ